MFGDLECSGILRSSFCVRRFAFVVICSLLFVRCYLFVVIGMFEPMNRRMSFVTPLSSQRDSPMSAQAIGLGFWP